MKLCVGLLVLGALVMGATVEAKVQVQPIPYQYGEGELEGILAWDDALPGKRPGILVVHEWWGLNEYARERAEQLAALGYVAFAVDMYGKGKVTDHGQQASQWAQEVTTNLSLWYGRALEGLKVLEAHPQVEPKISQLLDIVLGERQSCSWCMEVPRSREWSASTGLCRFPEIPRPLRAGQKYLLRMGEPIHS